MEIFAIVRHEPSWFSIICISSRHLSRAIFMHHSERPHSRHYLHSIIIFKIKKNINETNNRYWTDNDWNMLDSLICIRTNKKICKSCPNFRLYLFLAHYRLWYSRQLISIRWLFWNLYYSLSLNLVHLLLYLLSVFYNKFLLHLKQQASSLRKMFDSCIEIIKLFIYLTKVEMNLNSLHAMDLI